MNPALLIPDIHAAVFRRLAGASRTGGPQFGMSWGIRPHDDLHAGWYVSGPRRPVDIDQ